MAPNAERNNEKLFPIFRRNLSDGVLSTYIATADKLASWLSRDKAYYPYARPMIVELLETAYLSLRRASGSVHQPFHISNCPQSLKAWADPFIEMMRTVLPFYSLFVEQNLQNRLCALFKTIDLDPANIIPSVGTPPPRVASTSSASQSHAVKMVKGWSPHPMAARKSMSGSPVSGATPQSLDFPSPSPSMAPQLSSSAPKPKPKAKKKFSLQDDFIKADLEWFKDGRQVAGQEGQPSSHVPISPSTTVFTVSRNSVSESQPIAGPSRDTHAAEITVSPRVPHTLEPETVALAQDTILGENSIDGVTGQMIQGKNQGGKETVLDLSPLAKAKPRKKKKKGPPGLRFLPTDPLPGAISPLLTTASASSFQTITQPESSTLDPGIISSELPPFVRDSSSEDFVDQYGHQAVKAESDSAHMRENAHAVGSVDEGRHSPHTSYPIVGVRERQLSGQVDNSAPPHTDESLRSKTINEPIPLETQPELQREETRQPSSEPPLIADVGQHDADSPAADSNSVPNMIPEPEQLKGDVEKIASVEALELDKHSEAPGPLDDEIIANTHSRSHSHIYTPADEEQGIASTVERATTAADQARTTLENFHVSPDRLETDAVPHGKEEILVDDEDVRVKGNEIVTEPLGGGPIQDGSAESASSVESESKNEQSEEPRPVSCKRSRTASISAEEGLPRQKLKMTPSPLMTFDGGVESNVDATVTTTTTEDLRPAVLTTERVPTSEEDVVLLEVDKDSADPPSVTAPENCVTGQPLPMDVDPRTAVLRDETFVAERGSVIESPSVQTTALDEAAVEDLVNGSDTYQSVLPDGATIEAKEQSKCSITAIAGTAHEEPRPDTDIAVCDLSAMEIDEEQREPDTELIATTAEVEVLDIRAEAKSVEQGGVIPATNVDHGDASQATQSAVAHSSLPVPTENSSISSTATMFNCDTNMVVLNCARGTADAEITFRFDIRDEDATRISQWVSRDNTTDDDVSSTKCVSFAIYPFRQCLEKTQNDPELNTLEKMIVGVEPQWPNDGRLWATLENANTSHAIMLSPPFMFKVDEIYDISAWITPGKNVLHLHQLRDHSESSCLLLRPSLRRGVAYTPRAYKSLSAVPNPIPASFLRGGTSKGIYLNRADLPDDVAEWDPIFLGIMGSPDPKYGRQLNGMGGGVSSLSKICVVGAPLDTQRAAGIDLEYTFVQVGIRDEVLDFSGNCGNLTSMVGVFALDEGIVSRPGIIDTHSRIQTATISAFNTNTQKRINTTFPVSLDRQQPIAVLDLEQENIAGVHGQASQIVLDFVSPSGARTGKLLPSGKPSDSFTVPGAGVNAISMSLVDATNPTVFVSTQDLRNVLGQPDGEIAFNDVPVALAVEDLRRLGATRMGLDPETQAQPKIAIVDKPQENDAEADIVVHAYSMGVLHKAVPMTVGLCLGVAAGVEGTVPWLIANSRSSIKRTACNGESMIKIRHPGGVVVVGSEMKDGEVASAKVVRTGRRLMKGVVWW
ncbi:uncharacterized protein FIBRA_03566 [Fibroporia radiculosa]|uniref:DUF453-domain-containing protein n=1 Tax=Fibroporia radiculosa TaxID=599839 RepID=J4GNJ7_9APHY|nr:uncharacterized protein FIBRA_03566 [Fibroporia radiculosa]CCM01510.1 predicted protein [Fibroporia radiculosa]